MTTTSALKVAALEAALLASSCTGQHADDPTTSSGPLRLTDKHVGSMLYPLGEPAFITLPACGADGAFEATILSVTADEVTGADGVSFRAAWLGPGERLEIGAAALSRLEEPFEPAADSSGPVASCAEMPNTLEVAVVLPEAGDTAVVVDGFTVDYAVGPDEYTAHADVTYGVCAADPVDPQDEPAECRTSATG